jgi:hypothetical protein
MFAKNPCRKHFPKKIDKNADVRFSFFVLSRFRVFFGDGGSKTLQKNDLQKNRVETILSKQKNRQKNPKPIFFNHFCFNHVFGSFLGEGSSKTPSKKYQPKKSDPGPWSFFGL